MSIQFQMIYFQDSEVEVSRTRSSSFIFNLVAVSVSTKNSFTLELYFQILKGFMGHPQPPDPKT